MRAGSSSRPGVSRSELLPIDLEVAEAARLQRDLGRARTHPFVVVYFAGRGRGCCRGDGCPRGRRPVDHPRGGGRRVGAGRRRPRRAGRFRPGLGLGEALGLGESLGLGEALGLGEVLGLVLELGIGLRFQGGLRLGGRAHGARRTDSGRSRESVDVDQRHVVVQHDVVVEVVVDGDGQRHLDPRGRAVDDADAGRLGAAGRRQHAVVGVVALVLVALRRHVPHSRSLVDALRPRPRLVGGSDHEQKIARLDG